MPVTLYDVRCQPHLNKNKTEKKKKKKTPKQQKQTLQGKKQRAKCLILQKCHCCENAQNILRLQENVFKIPDLVKVRG